MARSVSLSTHWNHRGWFAPDTFGVLVTGINFLSFVALLFITIQFHWHDVSKLIHKGLCRLFLFVISHFGAVEGLIGKSFGIRVGSATISHILSTAPRTAFYSVASGFGSLWLANIFIGSSESRHERIFKHFLQGRDSSWNSRAEPRKLSSSTLKEFLMIIFFGIFFLRYTHIVMEFVWLVARTHTHLLVSSKWFDFVLHLNVAVGHISSHYEEE